MAALGQRVVVATFTGMDEAAIARGALEQEGIPVFLANEHLVTIAWQLSQATGGIRLAVAAKDAERARAILAASASALELVAERDGDTHASPAEAEQDATLPRADSLIERAWKSTLIGFLALPPIFHLWALWLLRRAYLTGGPRTERGRKLAKRTLIVSGCATIGFLAAYVRILFR